MCFLRVRLLQTMLLIGATTAGSESLVIWESNTMLCTVIGEIIYSVLQCSDISGMDNNQIDDNRKQWINIYNGLFSDTFLSTFSEL